MRTVELTDDANPAELVEAAVELEAEAAELEERRKALLDRAREIRTHAELVRIWARRTETGVNTNRVQVKLIQDRRGSEVPEKDYETVTNILRELQPTTLAGLARRLGVSEGIARNRMKVLEERGVAKLLGQRKWCLTGFDPIPKDTRALVRDIGCELDTFHVGDILDVTDLSRADVETILAEWVEKGTFEEDDGVYAYVPPESKTVNRPKGPAVENVVAASTPVRGEVVAGTGKGMRISDSEVRAYVAEVRRAGAEVTVGGDHYQVKYKGGTLPSIPKSPSDGRSLLNNRAQLKAAGLPL